MSQTTTLELLTSDYFWSIGTGKSLKSIDILDDITIGNTSNGNLYTHITTSNVTAKLFIGNLNGQVGTLSVNGNMTGSVLITGNGTDATTMNLELELDDVNSGSTGTFGSQTQIPQFNVDKYGRVSQLENVTISTTITIQDDSYQSGNVNLLDDILNIKGSTNQIVSKVTGNTITLSLDPNNVEIENLSLTGNLTVKNTTSKHTITLVQPNSLQDSYILTLPESDGIANQFLQTDGTGRLSWVTSDDSQQMFGNVITSGDYLTANTALVHLSIFDISYTTTLADSSVFLQYKVPYEASIQADQRISFIIKKSVNQQPETIVQTDGNLGPRNATGGMRNIYISNLFDTNSGNISDNIVYKLYSQLESNVTALDPLTGNNKTAGISFDTSGNYGSYMFKEFAN